MTTSSDLIEQQKPKKEDPLVKDPYYHNFQRFIKSEDTKYGYKYKLKCYVRYYGYTDCAQLIENKDIRVIELELINYLEHLRKEDKLTYGSAYTYLTALAHFFEINDVKINRRKISKILAE